jgi:hypothetical protein
MTNGTSKGTTGKIIAPRKTPAVEKALDHLSTRMSKSSAANAKIRRATVDLLKAKNEYENSGFASAQKNVTEAFIDANKSNLTIIKARNAKLAAVKKPSETTRKRLEKGLQAQKDVEKAIENNMKNLDRDYENMGEEVFEKAQVIVPAGKVSKPTVDDIKVKILSLRDLQQGKGLPSRDNGNTQAVIIE